METSVEQIKHKFQTHPDYLKLSEVIYKAGQAFYGKAIYKQDWQEVAHQTPYATEIHHVLNHPEATPEELWENYHRLFGQEPFAFTKEMFLGVSPEEWSLLIAITNALRHTVKPELIY